MPELDLDLLYDEAFPDNPFLSGVLRAEMERMGYGVETDAAAEQIEDWYRQRRWDPDHPERERGPDSSAIRYERDLFAEQLRDPAQLLNLLMDTRGVEPLPGYEWGAEGLPAAIRIPADLSRRVFGAPAAGGVSDA